LSYRRVRKFKDLGAWRDSG